MSAEQHPTGKTRGIVDGQLDWFVECGGPTELAGGNEMADPRRGRITKQVRIVRQQSKSYDRKHGDQHSYGVDQRGL